MEKYKLTPWNVILLEKMEGTRLVKMFTSNRCCEIDRSVNQLDKTSS
jgi:hypothetical protein